MSGKMRTRHRKPTHYHRKRGSFENLPELLATADEAIGGAQFLSGADVLRLIDLYATRTGWSPSAIPDPENRTSDAEDDNG